MSETARYWLKNFPPGMPADIDIGQHQSLLDILDEAVNLYGNSPAYFHLGQTISYKELDQLSLQLAIQLQQQYGIKKGDRIALMMPNILAHPIAMFAILRSGAIVVNVNPLYTARELEAQLNDSGARMIIVLKNFTDALIQIIDKTPVENILAAQVGDFHSPVKRWLINTVTHYIKKLKPADGLKSDSLMGCLHQTTGKSLINPDLSHDDIAFLQYTGGTTGRSKGAMLTHGNLVANTLQAHACMAIAYETKQPHVITALPLYHIFALTANCFVTVKIGGCSHLITNPRDMKNFLGELRKVKFHAITGVNTLFNAMLHHKDFQKLDFSHLELTLAGGMSTQRATADAWKKATGKIIVEAYGLTEASPAITANRVDLKEFSGSIGLPLPSTEVSIRDDKGHPLPPNSEGELWVRGPQVMAGYWNNIEETKQVITEDGWLKTGDIVSMNEEGYATVADRKKDLIIISGFNVYPNEVEAVLCDHPGIMEAGVIGINHDKTGECVKAVIVKKDPTLDKVTILKHCEKNLAAYKVPKVIEFVDELPKSNIGKILRRALR